MFQDADREYETARHAAQDAREARDGQAENQKAAKEKCEEVVKERHELQVWGHRCNYKCKEEANICRHNNDPLANI